MLFNSYEFIFVFLPITLLVYFLLAKAKYINLATGWLVCASLFFYSYWDIRYLPLLISSIVFNFIIGRLIEKSKNKQILYLGVGVNLLLLGYFKYTGFIISVVNDIVGANFYIPNIILPLGISFFTFTQTAYLIDVYRGETDRYSFLTYSLFVTVFPHLIAGPILYHKMMIPQFSRLRNFVFSHKNFALGLSMFSIGLFKKVVIADSLVPIVKVVFDNADKITFVEAWVGALGYTLQLYFDFSGYSEMAIGLGLMLNLTLPINFNSPYTATSIIDFWRRWHITLSVFLKDYLYIPLGGNRHGEFNRIKNLMLTMLLGGLWHGAGWTFLVWGGLHGIYLAVNHSWRKTHIAIPKYVAWLFTFTCVVVAWVFFRADTMQNALLILSAMCGFKGVYLPIIYEAKLAYLKNYGVEFIELNYFLGGFKTIVTIIVLTIFASTYENSQRIVAMIRPNVIWMAIIIILFFISFTKLNNVSEFLYFQF